MARRRIPLAERGAQRFASDRGRRVFPRNIDSGVCMQDANGRGVPGQLVDWMQPFRGAFTTPTWRHVLVLVMGAILVPVGAPSLLPCGSWGSIRSRIFPITTACLTATSGPAAGCLAACSACSSKLSFPTTIRW